jgi:hypothetical protein
MGSMYINLYSNQTDPWNKVGGVAWLLLKLDKEFGGQFRTKKLAGKIST